MQVFVLRCTQSKQIQIGSLLLFHRKWKYNNILLIFFSFFFFLFFYFSFPSSVKRTRNASTSNVVTVLWKMSKNRTTTDGGITCRSLIVVALIGSCCPVDHSTTTTDYRLTRPPSLEVRTADFRRDKRNIAEPDFFPAAVGSNTSCSTSDRDSTYTQKLQLHCTSNTVAKFLPFITSAEPHTQCFKHTTVYLTQLNDFKLWATKSEWTYYIQYALCFYIKDMSFMN